ncbi:MAG: hypothetical protein PHQ11_04620 [Paludibacter sp.]|nr:hypothetical protein [Paludibacter sp.]
MPKKRSQLGNKEKALIRKTVRIAEKSLTPITIKKKHAPISTELLLIEEKIIECEAFARSNREKILMTFLVI